MESKECENMFKHIEKYIKQSTGGSIEGSPFQFTGSVFNVRRSKTYLQATHQLTYANIFGTPPFVRDQSQTDSCLGIIGQAYISITCTTQMSVYYNTWFDPLILESVVVLYSSQLAKSFLRADVTLRLCIYGESPGAMRKGLTLLRYPNDMDSMLDMKTQPEKALAETSFP